jgi:hypothetical protein
MHPAWFMRPLRSRLLCGHDLKLGNYRHTSAVVVTLLVVGLTGGFLLGCPSMLYTLHVRKDFAETSHFGGGLLSPGACRKVVQKTLYIQIRSC